MNSTDRETELFILACELHLALSRLVSASDQFVRDTGMKHGDLITDASESARTFLEAGNRILWNIKSA